MAGIQKFSPKFMIINIGFKKFRATFYELELHLGWFSKQKNSEFLNNFGNYGHCVPTQKASLPFAVGKKKLLFENKKVIKHFLGLIWF